ncbi:MAG: hypothetical protein Q9186_002649 [Xanthomendoza sp. 1 TL-2023]
MRGVNTSPERMCRAAQPSSWGRRDAQEATLAGPRQDLQTWGPGQSVHEFGTPAVASTNPEREKGKDIEMVQTPEGNNDRRNSRRLKKFLPGRG